MEILDPRAIATPVYENLTELRHSAQENLILKQQKGQAVELYTYLSTWGLLRLKAEEKALKSQPGKQAVVEKFFECLQNLQKETGKTITGDSGLQALMELDTEEYLGLTGLALKVAQEFSFWATAIYVDIKLED